MNVAIECLKRPSTGILFLLLFAYGVHTHAAETSMPVAPPDGVIAYPRFARLTHQEGRVFLNVNILSNGQVNTVAIKTSSGFPVLDEAALASVKAWVFTPATHDGSPIDASMVLPVDFRLTDTGQIYCNGDHKVPAEFDIDPKSRVITMQRSAEHTVGVPESTEAPQPIPDQTPMLYPMEAREKGIQGKVVIRALVCSDGRPGAVWIERSSGSMLLDANAVVSVWKWQFVPAKRDGQMIHAWLVIPVSFDLELGKTPPVYILK